MIITHIGGPTVLIEVDGWTLLTDPTFDPAGGHYAFGWGTSSDKVTGPAMSVSDLPPIDAVLLTHDHHGDNLDRAGRELLSVRPHRADDAVRRAAARDAGRTRPRRRRRHSPDVRPRRDRGRRDSGAARATAVEADRRRRRGLRAAPGRQ